jgi:putative effector of murein hydrolase LrgA (UPF0299 family)
MEIMVAILVSLIMGVMVVLGVTGLVQEIIRRKKVIQQLKERKKVDKQI